MSVLSDFDGDYRMDTLILLVVDLWNNYFSMMDIDTLLGGLAVETTTIYGVPFVIGGMRSSRKNLNTRGIAFAHNALLDDITNGGYVVERGVARVSARRDIDDIRGRYATVDVLPLVVGQTCTSRRHLVL